MKEFKNLRQLATQIARLEGKRSQVRIGDIREILSILVQLCAEGSILREEQLHINPDSPLDLLIIESVNKHERGLGNDKKSH